MAAAEAIPEADYSFRPTPEVRTVAEQFGHIAESQNQFCVAAGAEAPSGPAQIEKATTDKSGLITALRSSFAACDPLFAAPDTALLRQVTPGAADSTSRLSILILNASHNFEHYGNLVTYMRMRGIVPPSSQP